MLTRCSPASTPSPPSSSRRVELHQRSADLHGVAVARHLFHERPCAWRTDVDAHLGPNVDASGTSRSRAKSGTEGKNACVLGLLLEDGMGEGGREQEGPLSR